MVIFTDLHACTGSVFSKRESSRDEQQSRHYRNQSTNKIVNAVLNKNLNPKQQVVALREASSRKKCRHVFRSAGMIDVEDHKEKTEMIAQTAKLLQRARQPMQGHRGVTDDQRSLAQSLAMGVLNTPPASAEGPRKKISAARWRLLGLSRRTGQRMRRSLQEKRRAIANGSLKSSWSKVKSREGFWEKTTPALRLRIQDWVRNHHHAAFAATGIVLGFPSIPQVI